MTPTEHRQEKTPPDPPLEWAWYEEQVERLSKIFPLTIAEQIAVARF